MEPFLTRHHTCHDGQYRLNLGRPNCVGRVPHVGLPVDRDMPVGQDLIGQCRLLES
jgi:hypothetical protein